MINNYNMGVINSTDEDVKNIISGVASDLKVFLNIPKNTPIYVNNDIDALSDSEFDESKPSVQPQVRKMSITYEESNDDFEDNSISFGYDEHIPIFSDTESNVKLSPIFKTFKYNLTIEISMKSKTIANAILNKIRVKDSLVRKDIRHADVKSKCFLDDRVLYLLDKLNDKRKEVYPDDTLSSYINKYRDKNVLKVVNSGGDNSKNILAIEFSYSNIYGRLITEANGLKPEYDETDREWNLTLDYEIRLDRILELNIQYPSMIFNKIINRDLIQNIDPYKHYANDPYYYNVFDELTRINREVYTDKTNLYVTIPSWDTKNLQPNGNDFRIIFSALLQLIKDHNELDPVCNLKQLGSKIKIQDDILAFLSTEYEYLLSLYKSVFVVNLYENDRLVHNDNLRIDSDLNVYIINKPINVKNIYRITYSICINPNSITQDAYDRVAASETLVEKLNNIVVINNVYNYDLYKSGKGDFSTKRRDIPDVMKTVQTVSIQAAGLLDYIGK